MKPNLVAAFTAFAILQIAVVLVFALHVPMILASWASSAALIAGLRTSPAARPWPVGLGHLISGGIGSASMLIAGSMGGFGMSWLIAPAVGLAVLAMMKVKALHPPAAANAAIPLIAKADPISFAIAVLFGAVLLSTLAAATDRIQKRREED